MDALTSLDDGIVYIAEESAPIREAGSPRRAVRWIAGALVAGIVVWITALSVGKAVRESRREQCADHLKRLGLALHAYHEKHDHFPSPAIAGRDGTPLLSWRVALLPHLGYRSLYERFHLDEPWDSPNNRALLREMPPEFACPAGPSRDTWSWSGPQATSEALTLRSRPRAAWTFEKSPTERLTRS
jgi:hypothetical protein